MRALGNGVIVDDDADLPSQAIWIGNNGYAYFTVWENGRSVAKTLHAFLMGGARNGSHIDHVNGNKLDNRMENLRFVSPQANQVNRKRLNRNNTSGVRGVTRNKRRRSKPWIAQIMVNGKMYYLGAFATVGEARKARQEAELLHFGEVCP